MFTKKNVITAKFINAEHTVIEVLTNIKDTVHSYALEYDKDSEDFQALAKAGWDLERVTEETAIYKQDASRLYDSAINAAAAEMNKTNEASITPSDIIETIIANNEDEDVLFKAKLTVMELDMVKGSKSTKAKQDIRKAKSLIELISEMNKL